MDNVAGVTAAAATEMFPLETVEGEAAESFTLTVTLPARSPRSTAVLELALGVTDAIVALLVDQLYGGVPPVADRFAVWLTVTDPVTGASDSGAGLVGVGAVVIVTVA